MQPEPLESVFENGRRKAEAGDFRAALPFFQAMLAQAKEKGSDVLSEPSHQSYYALCMTMVYGPSREAIQLSERAVSREFFNADLFCNLGLVYMRVGKRGPAFRAFRRGLALNAKHARIRQALHQFEMRQQPVFSFLPRGHFLNRVFGRLRTRIGNGSES